MVRTQDNADGIEKTLEYMEREFNGLCFVNLVDFDMLYGHRNDVAGYAKALTYFDRQLPRILSAMEPEDVLMITADHGCDPGHSVHGSFQGIYAVCDVWKKSGTG